MPCTFPSVSLPHSDWPDSEAEDWNGERQKEKEWREKEQKGNEQKELELKSENNKKEEYYLPSPQYTSYSKSGFDDSTLAPTVTDTSVPAPENKSNEE